jgi:negative regulator of flagellin synthesis FlgM
MPPIEFGLSGPRGPRAIGAADGRATRGPVANDTARAHASPQSAVIRASTIEPGEPPVDADRVSTIRKAIESGSYPVIPMRVADAMIAAGLLLRSTKA